MSCGAGSAELIPLLLNDCSSLELSADLEPCMDDTIFFLLLTHFVDLIFFFFFFFLCP